LDNRCQNLNYDLSLYYNPGEALSLDLSF